MTPISRATAVACTFFLALAGTSAFAGATAAAGGSSVGISASSASSASSKGSSNSIEGSSDSSSKDKTAMVQDGTYRVATVAPDAQGGTVRLGLEPQGMAGAQAWRETTRAPLPLPRWQQTE